MEQEIGFFQYSRVNPNNLILTKPEYDGLRQRICGTKESKRECIPEKDKSGEVLEQVLCELKGTQETEEKEIEEVNLEQCLQEAEDRRAAIKLAKDKLVLKSGPSLVLQRALGLSNALKINEQQIALKIKIEEDWKKRNAELDRLTFESIKKEDDSRKKTNKLKIQEMVETNKILVERKIKKEEEEGVKRAKEEQEILCLTEKWKKRIENDKFKRCLKNKILSMENQDMVRMKQEIEKERLQLEAIEDRENEIFINYKSDMVKRGNIKMIDDRERRLEVVIDRTNDWIRSQDQEGNRDRKLAEVYAYEKWLRDDDDRRKCNVKQKHEGLAEFWKHQIEEKMANRRAIEEEWRKDYRARVQQDCEDTRQDTEAIYKRCVKSVEIANYNRSMEEKKRRDELTEKEKGKIYIEKNLERFKELDAKLEETKKEYLELGKKSGKNIIPILKANLNDREFLI